MSRELKDSYLLKQFMSDFDKLPAYLIKAPGRINLIGEHTDYNGLPVMPAPPRRATPPASTPAARRSAAR